MENKDVDNHQGVQRTWELNKIGNFDMESWKEIFKYLDLSDLLMVAVVCKSFQSMAENIAAQRFKYMHNFMHNGIHNFDIGWKPVICRFKNVISNITVYGPKPDPSKDTSNVLSKDLSFIDEFLSNTLTRLSLDHANVDQLQDFVFHKKFLKLEKLSFGSCNLNNRCSIFSQLRMWCPNLKSLSLSCCTIRSSLLLLQCIPLLEDLSLYGVPGISIETFIIFVTRHRQLKTLYVDLKVDVSFSCLPIINELLINLESLIWQCTSLDRLPNFRQNFFNLKVLGFVLSLRGTYTNELNTIVQYLPQIEEIKVLLCKENKMSNDDLVDLIVQSSCTLKKLVFTSIGLDKELKVGYDLHRQIYNATSNRSEILIEVEFGEFQFEVPPVRYIITKEWIKKNGKLIVLKELNY